MCESRLFVCDEKVARHIHSERRRTPRKRHATTTVSVVVNEELAAETLRIDNKTARAIRPQPNDFANDPITRNVHGRKMALRVEGQRRTRGYQCGARYGGATQEIASID
jgi:hypothetical protein